MAIEAGGALNPAYRDYRFTELEPCSFAGICG